jgi:hypothetical protein
MSAVPNLMIPQRHPAISEALLSTQPHRRSSKSHRLGKHGRKGRDEKTELTSASHVPTF